MLLAVLASVALVLAAPYMGLLRTWLGNVFPDRDRFVVFMTGAIATAVAVVAILAIMRIRTHRLARFAAIALALAIAAAYSRAVATGAPEVDIVERVHFIEYGLIAFLYYRASRPAGDLSVIALPILAGVVVGTIEEWFQWFIPNRVGELHDVALNLVAVVCGLMISVALAPPARIALSLSAGSRRRVAAASAGLILAVAFFTDQIHLGHEVSAEDFRFRSHWTASELAALSADRAARWKTNPPITWRRMSREDQYMDEGLWHARRRNQRWDRTDHVGAWQENRILEIYFSPMLDTPSYVSPGGHRWPQAQRENAQRFTGGPYTSDAQPYPLVLVPHWLWRLGAVVAIAAIVGLGGRRPPRRTDLK